MKGFRVTKIVKEVMFEGVWGEVESKKCFQRQSFKEYLRLTQILLFKNFFLVLTKFSFFR